MKGSTGSNLDDLLEKMPSKYSVTMAVAQRAKQLEGGARCFLDHAGQTSVSSAIEEIRQGKVELGYREPGEEEEEELVLAPQSLADVAVPEVEDEAQPEAEEAEGEAEEKPEE